MSCSVCHIGGIAVKIFLRHPCVMSRDDLHFRLRIPKDLKDRVEAAASRMHRSMTAEIVATLEEKYPPEDDLRELLLSLIEIIGDQSKKDECVRIAYRMKEIVEQPEYDRSLKNDLYMASMAMLRELKIISNEEFERLF